MDHKSLHELERRARIYVMPDRKTRLSRRERLTRWAELLEREPDRRLGTLPRTEHVAAGRRAAIRRPDSAITVAFEDAVLRREGLVSDTYGAAKDFFSLTDRQLHFVTCYCQFGPTVSAARAAERLRVLVPRRPLLEALKRWWPFGAR